MEHRHVSHLTQHNKAHRGGKKSGGKVEGNRLTPSAKSMVE